MCRAVLGSSWILHEPLTSIGFTAPRPLKEQKHVDAIKKQVKSDVKRPAGETDKDAAWICFDDWFGNAYWNGKEAARLAGAVLYRRDEDSEEPVEAYEPSTKLEGLRVVDAHGGAVGVVWDVLDPNEGAALAAPLLEVELAETRHCLVPLDPTCVEVYEEEVVLLNTGLLDLAFDYAPPPPVIRGCLLYTSPSPRDS